VAIGTAHRVWDDADANDAAGGSGGSGGSNAGQDHRATRGHVDAVPPIAPFPAASDVGGDVAAVVVFLPPGF